LIAGYGKLGRPLAESLANDHNVFSLHRSPPGSGADTVEHIIADVTRANTLQGQLPDDLDYLVYCLSPSERSPEAYKAVFVDGFRNVRDALPSQTRLKRVFFVSSTSVYHQDNHDWVDEGSPTYPEKYAGRILCEAEQAVQHCGHPATVIRFSGIYGGPRNRLIEQVRNGNARYSSEPRLTNRIHQEDCVGFLKHLLEQDMREHSIEPLYLASDSHPAELNEVLEFIASKLAVSLKTAEPGQDVSRRSGNKKCSNRRMLASGYSLRYPDYISGYGAGIESTKKSTKQ